MILTTAERSARYRAKDVEAYRKYKRELARTSKHRKRRREYQRKWRKEHRKEYNEYCYKVNLRRRKGRSPDERHSEHIKRFYGLSKTEFREMLNSQKKRCAICKTSKPGGRRRWAVDHCHKRGFVRGLLCNWCNARLGWYEKHFHAARRYIRRGPYKFADGFRMKRKKISGSRSHRTSVAVRRWWRERKQVNPDVARRLI